MKWIPKFVTPHTLRIYFRLTHYKLKEIRSKLKGTPHIKPGNRCSNISGKHYWLYDIEYIMDVLGFKPIKAVPDRLIISME